MGSKRFNILQIASALRKHDGIVPRAAQELNTPRQTIHERIARSTELQAVMLEIEQDMKDNAEGAIAAAIKNGDMPTVRWFAERRMREKYGARVDVEIDTAALEALAEAIAAHGGMTGLRAVRAVLAGYGR